MYRIFLILILISSNTIFSKQIQGVVKDEFGEKMPYVNIGIRNKVIGTISQRDGSFELKIDSTHLNDSIKLSYIGYKSRLISVKELLNKFNTINLDKEPYQIGEVIIIPKIYDTEILGCDDNTAPGTISFSSRKHGGYEVGILMEVDNSPSFIDKIGANIVSFNGDSILLRFNIYDVDLNSIPNKSLLNNPIYYTHKKTKSNNIIIDISNLNLVVKNDFFVCLEIVDFYNCSRFSTHVSFFGGDMVCREASQSKWKNFPLPFDVAIYSIVKYEHSGFLWW